LVVRVQPHQLSKSNLPIVSIDISESSEGEG
jgi:hypothetical protein